MEKLIFNLEIEEVATVQKIKFFRHKYVEI